MIIFFLAPILAIILIVAFIPNLTSILQPREISILIWTDSEGNLEEAIQPIISNIQKSNGVKIVVETSSYDELHDKIVNAYTNGEPYDLMAIDDAWIAEFVATNWLEPMDKHFTTEIKQNLVKSSVEGATYNNTIYGFPYFADIHTFYYNTEILKTAKIKNPPQDWNEFIQDSILIKELGLCEYPVAWSWKQGGPLSRDFFTILFSFGGKITDPGNIDNGQLYFADESGVETLNLMIDIFSKYNITDPQSLTYSEENVLNLFSAGETAFWLNCPYAPPILENNERSSVVGQWNTSLVPGLKPEMSGTIVYSMSYAISASSNEKDVVWELIKSISGPDIQLKMTENQWIPTYKSVFTDPDAVKYNSAFPTMLNQFEYATPRPNFSWWDEFSLTMETEIQKALNKEQTAEETLENCLNATNNFRTTK